MKNSKQEQGVYALKIDKENKADVLQGYADFYQYMADNYKEKKSTEYNHLIDLRYGGLKNEEFDKKLHFNIKNYISDNLSFSLQVFEEKMIKKNVSTIHIKP